MCFVSPSKPNKRPGEEREGQLSLDGVYLETGSPPSMVLTENESTSNSVDCNHDNNNIPAKASSKEGGDVPHIVVPSPGTLPTSPGARPMPLEVDPSPIGALSTPLRADLSPLDAFPVPLGTIPNPRNGLVSVSSAPRAQVPLLWSQREPDSCSRTVPVDKLCLKNPRWGQKAGGEGTSAHWEKGGSDVDKATLNTDSSSAVDTAQTTDSCGVADSTETADATDATETETASVSEVGATKTAVENVDADDTGTNTANASKISDRGNGVDNNDTADDNDTADGTVDSSDTADKDDVVDSNDTADGMVDAADTADEDDVVDNNDTADGTVDTADTTDADNTSDTGEPIDTEAMIRNMQQQLLNFNGPATSLLSRVTSTPNLDLRTNDHVASSLTFDLKNYYNNMASRLLIALLKLWISIMLLQI